MESYNRIGRISSIDYKKGTANVYFEGMEQDMKTRLPFLSTEYHMPEVNDLVLVAFQIFNHKEQGYIIGKYFSDENPPEGGLKPGCYFKRVRDDTFVEADEKGNIHLKLPGTADIAYTVDQDRLNVSTERVDILKNHVAMETDNNGNVRIDLPGTASIVYDAGGDTLTLTAGRVYIVNTRP